MTLPKTRLDRREVLGLVGGACAGVAYAGVAYAGVAYAGVATSAGYGPILDRLYLDELALDPFRASQVGQRPRDGQAWRTWTIKDEAWFGRNLDQAHAALAATAALGDSLDVNLFRYAQRDRIERIRWHDHDYLFYGSLAPPVAAISTLIGRQLIASADDADAYIARVADIPRWIDSDMAVLRRRASAGVRLPQFNFADIAADLGRLEQSFEPSAVAQSPLVTDFRVKAQGAGLPRSQVQADVVRLIDVIAKAVCPAIARMRAELQREAAAGGADRGVWALPGGQDYYLSLIRSHTSMAGDPDELHRYGLDEVARLTAAIAALAQRLGTSGNASGVLRFLATDRRFFLPDTAAGRSAYLERASQAIAAVMRRLPDILTLPLHAELAIKEVDPVSAASSGRAFYLEPGNDGGPGIFYLNTAAMANNPVYQLEAVVHHEAVPGHHLQAAVLDQRALPLFRRQYYIGAFAEGWACYAEKLAGELGLDTTPEAEAGRLSLELFRATRLVVDTGIHAKRWTFAQALAFMNDNTGNPPGDNLVEIKRYFNWPGQALSYKVGMRHIEALRARAATAGGSTFSLPKFHDVVLASGSRPLGMLAADVDAMPRA